MRFGNCISFKNTEHIDILRKVGFDYVEIPLAPVYTAANREVSDFIRSLEKNNIRCEAVNVLFPGDIALTGDKADVKTADKYLSEIFAKTKDFGYEIVVFGSGGARRCPDGFAKEKATEQIIDLTQNILCGYAEKYNFTIAIEELNSSETNLINSLAEAKYISDRVNSPQVKVLADFYHIALENDDISQLGSHETFGDILAHCHIANPHKRYYPHKTDDENTMMQYKEFFRSLKRAGYDKRLSVEGSLGAISEDFEEESRLTLENLKSLANS